MQINTNFTIFHLQVSGKFEWELLTACLYLQKYFICCMLFFWQINKACMLFFWQINKATYINNKKIHAVTCFCNLEFQVHVPSKDISVEPSLPILYVIKS